jgi:hypothetical protein
VTALVLAAARALPVLVFAAGPLTSEAFLEFLTAKIRNPQRLSREQGVLFPTPINIWKAAEIVHTL